MASSREFSDVKLKTGIESSFLEETLTTDIELTDALFDLIDNSIDAARNNILKNKYEKDTFGLPSDYSEFHIKLRFGLDSICIVDNCYGFEDDSLINSAFYTGKRSNHNYGIGHYGLGLKRALLKSGSKFGLVTDNGSSLYKVVFDNKSFSNDNSSFINAKKYNSSERKRTFFIATGLKSNVIHQITDAKWFENALEEMSVRYSMFIKKGLRITVVNSIPNKKGKYNISSKLPSLRQGRPLVPFTDRMSSNNVDIFFDVGAHSEFKFAGEVGHNPKNNERITNTYGIYFICNDRIIVAASKERKHGFTASFHSEHGGFICLVRIIGKDPADLPWNTAKTELKTNSSLFLELRLRIEKLALKYRSDAKKLINIWTEIKKQVNEESIRKLYFSERTGLIGSSDSAICEPNSNITTQINVALDGNVKPSGVDNSQSTSKPILIAPGSKKLNAKKNKNKHTQNWKTLLPESFNISGVDNVLDNILIEATTLVLSESPHAACLLYRSLIEASLKVYAKRTGHYAKVIEHFYTKGAGKNKGHNDEYKKNQQINLNIALSWFRDSSQLFPIADRKLLKQCVNDTLKHVGKMNGVVHCENIISDSEMIVIRNETIHFLVFLLAEIHSTSKESNNNEETLLEK
ncbi:ATP-binding protein [Yersinia enterocolitica]|uniref:ATP-binding protein n=1 Tax=Yersinia enterocolitica TaxID=630 RepID=UPI003CFC56DD